MSTQSVTGNRERGWKSSLLLPLAPYEPSDGFFELSLVNRRQALKTCAALTAGVGTFNFVRPQDAEAGILGWVAATGFAAAISWLVENVLDAVFSDDPDELGFKKIKPQPTGSDFHDNYSEPWIITNENYHIRDRHLGGFGVTCGVQEFLRLTDLNCEEINAIKGERQYYGMLLPTGKRREFTRYDYDLLDQANYEYAENSEKEVSTHHVKYVRDFNDSNGNAHGALAVARGRKAQLMIV